MPKRDPRILEFSSLALALTLAACASTPPPEPPFALSRPELNARPLAEPPPRRVLGPEGNGSVALLIGGRKMSDGTAWEGLDDPFAIGLELAFTPFELPIGFELGVVGSFQTQEVDVFGGTIEVDGEVSEFYFGPRAVFELPESPAELYAGAGLTLATAEVSAAAGPLEVFDDDGSAGFYLHGGIQAHLGDVFLIGVDFRLVTGTDIELFGVPSDADYRQLALVLGASF